MICRPAAEHAPVQKYIFNMLNDFSLVKPDHRNFAVQIGHKCYDQGYF